MTDTTEQTNDDFDEHMTSWRQGWDSGFRSAVDQIQNTVTALTKYLDEKAEQPGAAPDEQAVTLHESVTLSGEPYTRAGVAAAVEEGLKILHGSARAAGGELDLAAVNIDTGRNDDGHLVVEVYATVNVERKRR